MHFLYLGRRPYITGMVLRSFGRGRPLNAPAAYRCQPIVAKQPPRGPGWGHELKHGGYRLQIHVRDGRVRLYTINGANWSKRYPLMGITTFGCAPWKVSTWRVNLDDDGMDCFGHCHS